MHDLRKKILLESGKKSSRKARSQTQSARGSAAHSPNLSPGNSRPGSRHNSRPSSRYASEEDETLSDSDVDDVMTISTNSASDLDAGDDWKPRLQSLITGLQDRKHSSTDGRIEYLTFYLHLVRYHFTGDQLCDSLPAVLPTLLKSIKSGNTPAERDLAMKALAVTAITCANEDMYGQAFQALKSVSEEAEEEELKAQAILTMSVVVIYGGASVPEREEFLDFLTEVTETDGHHISAPDSAVVVTAAMQAWAFVATSLEDIAGTCYQALDAFVEQLDSSDPDVQITAGANIALLFEVARHLEEAEDGESLNLQVDPKYLVKRMTDISRGSKAVSKRNRKHVRTNFASIITSLERGKGPGWSTAGRPTSNPNTGGSRDEGPSQEDVVEFGYRERIKLDGDVYTIESWATMARIDTMKQVLKGGFPIHFAENEVVSNTLENLQFCDRQLDAVVSSKDIDSPKRKPRGGGKVMGAMWD